MLIKTHGLYHLEGDGHFDMFVKEYEAPLPFSLGPDDVVLDLGANVGVFSCLALEAGARVLAVEPVKEIFAALEKNCAEHGKGKTFWCFNFAASDRDGLMVPMYVNLQNTGFCSVENFRGMKAEREVMTVTVDTLCWYYPVTVIKMDIEGSEVKAIHGAARTIRNNKPKMLIAIEHRGDDLELIPKAVEEICPGYTGVIQPSRGAGDWTMYFEWQGK